MKVLIVLALACLALAEEKYPTKYDNINVDEVLRNERLLSKYVDCMLEKPGVKCTPDGKTLKDNLPDALKTDCAKCSEVQKTNSDKVIKFLLEKKPDLYKQIEAKYDPDQTYRKKYQKN